VLGGEHDGRGDQGGAAEREEGPVAHVEAERSDRIHLRALDREATDDLVVGGVEVGFADARSDRGGQCRAEHHGPHGNTLHDLLQVQGDGPRGRTFPVRARETWEASERA